MRFTDAVLAGVVLNREAIQSDSFVSGASGWRVLKTGSAEFNDVVFRGDAQSSNFVSGSSGWRILRTGSAEFNDVTIRGDAQSNNFVSNSAGWRILRTGAAQFNDVTIRGDAQSNNFVSGSAGWRILRTGSAEFNDIVIRGGTSVNGDFLAYNGTPALGNLVVSVSANGGTDAFGNVYAAGSVSYGTFVGVDYYSAIQGAQILLGLVDGSAQESFIQFQNVGGNQYELFMTSGRKSGSYQNANISLVSESAIGVHDHAVYLDAETVQVTNDLEVTRNVFAANMQSGEVAFSSAEVSANGVGNWTNNKAVVFDTPFTAVPNVQMTCSAGGPASSTTALTWTASGITTTGFNARMLRGNNTATTFNYLAMNI